MKYLTISIFVTVGILLATTTIASSYIVQPAKADCAPNLPYGQGCVSQEANPHGSNPIGGTGGSAFGGAVSGLAQGGGLQDLRASGCGANQFSVTVHGANDVCP